LLPPSRSPISIKENRKRAFRRRREPKPGTDFFIAYNELDERAGNLVPKNRSLSVKLNYLFVL
jgi:hypothetical protein